MRPDPAIVARLLALPIETRRRLAAQPGPGWWFAALRGEPMEMGDDGRPFASPEQRTVPDWSISAGWAWYPADSAAWMKAAAGERRWVLHRGGAMITGQEDDYPTAEECALSWFEAGK